MKESMPRLDIVVHLIASHFASGSQVQLTENDFRNLFRVAEKLIEISGEPIPVPPRPPPTSKPFVPEED